MPKLIPNDVYRFVLCISLTYWKHKYLYSMFQYENIFEDSICINTKRIYWRALDPQIRIKWFTSLSLEHQQLKLDTLCTSCRQLHPLKSLSSIFYRIKIISLEIKSIFVYLIKARVFVNCSKTCFFKEDILEGVMSKMKQAICDHWPKRIGRS